jgi:hypothetical protein
MQSSATLPQPEPQPEPTTPRVSTTAQSKIRNIEALQLIHIRQSIQQRFASVIVVTFVLLIGSIIGWVSGESHSRGLDDQEGSEEDEKEAEEEEQQNNTI